MSAGRLMSYLFFSYSDKHHVPPLRRFCHFVVIYKCHDFLYPFFHTKHDNILILTSFVHFQRYIIGMWTVSKLAVGPFSISNPTHIRTHCNPVHGYNVNDILCHRLHICRNLSDENGSQEKFVRIGYTYFRV